MIDFEYEDWSSLEDAALLAMDEGVVILRKVGMETREILKQLSSVAEPLVHPYRANHSELREAVVIDSDTHRAGVWHSDESFLEHPPDLTVLSMKVPSDVGGETEFIDLREAWKALPQRLRGRALAGDQTCLHTTPDGDASFEHPLIQVAGKRVYPFVNRLYCARSIASDERGVEPLLELLLGVERFRSSKVALRSGDLALWNNRALIHRARPYASRRRIERLSFRLP